MIHFSFAFYFSSFRNAEIDCRDKDKKSPLMNAARKNNVETVKLLLQRGADVTVKDATDKTSLYMAAEDDCWDVLNVRNFVLTGLLAETSFVESQMSVVFCYSTLIGFKW